MLEEVQLVGLVGPTHHYAGMSWGNVASERHKGSPSSPRRAALQSVALMRELISLDQHVLVMPPLYRPDLSLLERFGLRGTGDDLLRSAALHPDLLSMASSASSMWTANAGTWAPGRDTQDGVARLVVANLVAKAHRSLEPPGTEAHLRAIFGDDPSVEVLSALPSTPAFGDEGAANHMRLASPRSDTALHVFVYGRLGDEPADAAWEERNPTLVAAPLHQGTPPLPLYPARQSLRASQAVARRLHLAPEQTFFLRQHPQAIRAGVFHNDVAAISCGAFLLHHELAYVEDEAASALWERCAALLGEDYQRVVVPAAEVSLEEAVRTYLFNGQLFDRGGGRLVFLLPDTCRTSEAVQRCLTRICRAHRRITEVRYVDLHQSMRNGGGPACLRLRLQMTAEQLQAVPQGFRMTLGSLDQLEHWASAHLADELHPADLAEPSFVAACHRALDALRRVLDAPSLYAATLGA